MKKSLTLLTQIILVPFILSLACTKSINAGDYQCNCHIISYDCAKKVTTCEIACLESTPTACACSPTTGCICAYRCVTWGTVCTDTTEWVKDGCTKTVCDTCCDELNTAPDQPTSASLTSDEGTYALSLDENNPTTVNLTNATVTLPEFTQTANSGIGYQFRYYDTEGTLIDTTESTSNTQTIPAGVITTMNTGGTFKISGLYYTVNECDTTKKYSTPLETYIVTINRPQLTCTDTGCDLSDIFNNLGSESSYGCSNTEYTGIEMNNPLNINLTLEDEDGNDEIQGAIIWFRDITSTQIQNLGIKVIKNTSWDSLSIYSTLGNSWNLVTNEFIQNTKNENISRISNTIATYESNVNINFLTELLPAENTLQGTYDIFVQGLDIYTVDKTNLDPNQMTKIGELGIDLVNPTVEDEISIDLTDIQNILFSWNSEDLESGILSTQVNGYVKTDNTIFQTSPIYLNDIEITNVTAPEGEDSEQIGLMDDPYGINILPPTEEIGLNIRDNEYGNISIYVRVFDNACNSEIRTNSISFAPWTASKGGYFYSKSGTRIEAQDISGQTDLNSELIHFNVSTLSQGTEILASRTQYIYQLLHPELKAVSATAVEDSNNLATYWYKRIKNIAENENNLSSANDTCESEYCFYSTENDITLDSEFVCTSNTVFISDGDITISPINKETTTVETNNDTACIFIAKNNIIITNEGHTSTTKEIAYDYLEGFFVAENQIIINSGNTDEDKKYGLEVEGGLVAFGNTDSRSIQNNRSLGAMNLISPSLLVNFHPKYSKISEELVGTMATTYIKEIGLDNK
jgi:hypothetical protein